METSSEKDETSRRSTDHRSGSEHVTSIQSHARRIASSDSEYDENGIPNNDPKSMFGIHGLKKSLSSSKMKLHRSKDQHRPRYVKLGKTKDSLQERSETHKHMHVCSCGRVMKPSDQVSSRDSIYNPAHIHPADHNHLPAEEDEDDEISLEPPASPSSQNDLTSCNASMVSSGEYMRDVRTSEPVPSVSREKGGGDEEESEAETVIDETYLEEAYQDSDDSTSTVELPSATLSRVSKEAKIKRKRDSEAQQFRVRGPGPEYLLKYGNSYCPFCHELFGVDRVSKIKLKRHLAKELWFDYDKAKQIARRRTNVSTDDTVIKVYKEWIDRFVSEQMHADLFRVKEGVNDEPSNKPGTVYYECPLCLKIQNILRDANSTDPRGIGAMSAMRPLAFFNLETFANHLYHHLRWGGRKCTLCPGQYIINSIEEIEKHFEESHYDMVPKSAPHAKHEAMSVIMTWYDKFEPMENYIDNMIKEAEKSGKERAKIKSEPADQPATSVIKSNPNITSENINGKIIDVICLD